MTHRANISLLLGDSDLLPVFETEWDNGKGKSVLVKCATGITKYSSLNCNL